MGNDLSSPRTRKVVVRGGDALGDLVTCASDPAETWCDLCRRTVEKDYLSRLLPLLVRIHPESRLAAYRLRYDCGYATVVRPTWISDGINNEVDEEDAFLDVNVSLRPSVENEGTVSPFAPHESILSSLGDDGAENTIFVDLRCEKTVVGGVAPFPVTRERTNALFCNEHECFPGCIDEYRLEKLGDGNDILPQKCINVELREAEEASGENGKGGAREGGDHQNETEETVDTSSGEADDALGGGKDDARDESRREDGRADEDDQIEKVDVQIIEGGAIEYSRRKRKRDDSSEEGDGRSVGGDEEEGVAKSQDEASREADPSPGGSAGGSKGPSTTDESDEMPKKQNKAADATSANKPSEQMLGAKGTAASTSANDDRPSKPGDGKGDVASSQSEEASLDEGLAPRKRKAPSNKSARVTTNVEESPLKKRRRQQSKPAAAAEASIGNDKDEVDDDERKRPPAKVAKRATDKQSTSAKPSAEDEDNEMQSSNQSEQAPLDVEQSPRKKKAALSGKDAKTSTDVEESPPRKRRTGKSKSDDQKLDKRTASKKPSAKDKVSNIEHTKLAIPRPTKQKTKRKKKEIIHQTGEVDGDIPAEPAVGFPAGWTQRQIPRASKPSHKDKRFYSPMMDYRFRTKPEADCFLELIEEADGDEVEAMRLFKERRPARNAKGKKSDKSRKDGDDDAEDDETPKMLKGGSKRRRKAVVAAVEEEERSNSATASEDEVLPKKSRAKKVYGSRGKSNVKIVPRFVARDAEPAEDQGNSFSSDADTDDLIASAKSQPVAHKKRPTALPAAKAKAQAKKTADDPKAPKQSPNAYVLFCKDYRQRIAKENPDLKGKELNDKMKKVYRSLGDDDLKPYKEKAAKLRKKWEADMVAYEDTLG